MKYFIIFLLFVVGISIAQSVTVQKSVECTDTETLFRGLINSDYKEKPIWWGVELGSNVSKYSLFVNEQTKSWTLIQFDEKVACVLGAGENSTRIFTGPRI